MGGSVGGSQGRPPRGGDGSMVFTPTRGGGRGGGGWEEARARAPSPTESLASVASSVTSRGGRRKKSGGRSRRGGGLNRRGDNASFAEFGGGGGGRGGGSGSFRGQPPQRMERGGVRPSGSFQRPRDYESDYGPRNQPVRPPRRSAPNSTASTNTRGLGQRSLPSRPTNAPSTISATPTTTASAAASWTLKRRQTRKLPIRIRTQSTR